MSSLRTCRLNCSELLCGSYSTPIDNRHTHTRRLFAGQGVVVPKHGTGPVSQFAFAPAARMRRGWCHG